METLQGVHHFHGGIGMAALGLLLLLIRVRWRWVAILGLALGIAGPLIKGTVMAADDLFHRLEGTPGK